MEFATIFSRKGLTAQLATISPFVMCLYGLFSSTSRARASISLCMLAMQCGCAVRVLSAPNRKGSRGTLRAMGQRSEESSAGDECGSRCRSRGQQCQQQKIVYH